MITSAKTLQEEDDDEEEEEEFIVKKEPTSHPKGIPPSYLRLMTAAFLHLFQHFLMFMVLLTTGNLSVKLDVKSNDQKPCTPRSKHSATEQRRRSKINDRHVYFVPVDVKLDSINLFCWCS